MSFNLVIKTTYGTAVVHRCLFSLSLVAQMLRPASYCRHQTVSVCSSIGMLWCCQALRGFTRPQSQIINRYLILM